MLVGETLSDRDRRGQRKTYHTCVTLLLDAFGYVSRQQWLSWEVQLKANEAEQTLLQRKQFSMAEMAKAEACVLHCHCVKEPRGVRQAANRLVNNL